MTSRFFYTGEKREYFYYPFIYSRHGDNRGFLKIGMAIRNHYLKWVATENYKHVERAVPEIALFVGWQWKKIFGNKDFDYDIIDPVAYIIIFEFVKQKLPIDYSIAHWIRTIARRNLLREAYRKAFIPEQGDASIRTFSYKPFPVAADVEHRIFIEEMKEIILDYIEHCTRLDFNERQACRYIAESLIAGKRVSPLVLSSKYRIPDDRMKFYIDFTKVVMRNELYKIREDIPELYGSEKEPFVVEFHDWRDEDEEEDAESEDEEENIELCYF